MASALTLSDARHLRQHLRRFGDARSGVYALVSKIIEKKLDFARIIDDAVDLPGLATTGREFTFCIDGRSTVSAELYHFTERRAAGEEIPVASLLGATLLGMRVGQFAPLIRTDMDVCRLRVLRVAEDPGGRPHRAISSLIRGTISKPGSP